MTYTFDPNRFELIEFYSYPCCVVDRSEEYAEKFDTFKGDKSVKDFFEVALKHTESIVGRNDGFLHSRKYTWDKVYKKD